MIVKPDVADCATYNKPEGFNEPRKCNCISPMTNLGHPPVRESPMAPPIYDVTHQSTCFFLHLFCYQASQLYGAPLFDYLPKMLASIKPTHCLHQSIKAVSRMTLADRYSGNDIRLLTGRYYIQALGATKEAVQDRSEAVRDETVVAVWLLSLYEVWLFPEHSTSCS